MLTLDSMADLMCPSNVRRKNMKYWAGCLIGFILLGMAARATADDCAPITYLAVQSVGLEDDAMVDRIARHMQQNLWVKVRVKSGVDLASTSLRDVTEQVAKEKAEDEVAIVALTGGLESKHDFVLNTNVMVMAIDVSGLEEGSADRETFGRRVDKVTMFGISRLFGMPPSPDPHCASHGYQTRLQLDTLGRNYNPPSMQQWDAAAKDKGLTRDYDFSRSDPE